MQGRLDQLHDACGRLTVTVEVLSGPGDPPGDLGSTSLAAAFDPDKDEADDADGEEEDGDHGDEDGRHEKCLSDSHRGRNCLAAIAGRAVLPEKQFAAHLVSLDAGSESLDADG